MVLPRFSPTDEGGRDPEKLMAVWSPSGDVRDPVGNLSPFEEQDAVLEPTDRLLEKLRLACSQRRSCVGSEYPV